MASDNQSSSATIFIDHFRARDDDIDFASVLRILTDRRRLLAGAALVGGALALFAALTFPPSYKANTQLSPPLHQDIAALSVRDQEKVVYTPYYVWGAFLANLNSNRLRRAFYQHSIASNEDTDNIGRSIFPALRRITAKQFEESLKIKIDGEPRDWIEVVITADRAQDVTRWLNDYIETVASATKQQVITQIKADLEFRKQFLRRTIDSKVALAEQRRKDIIEHLEEDHRIAEKLGITENAMGAAAGNDVVVNASGQPRFMRGTKALQAQIDVLRSREIDMGFIPDVRTWEEELSFLDSIAIDANRVTVVHFENHAQSIGVPPFIKQIIMVVAGVIFGVLVAVIYALMVERIAVLRASSAASAADPGQ